MLGALEVFLVAVAILMWVSVLLFGVVRCTQHHSTLGAHNALRFCSQIEVRMHASFLKILSLESQCGIGKNDDESE